MNRFTKAEWHELINQCKSSGLSDWEWCRQNHIPQSSFYYQLRKLRSLKSETSEAVQIMPTTPEMVPAALPETHEVVPLIIRDDYNSNKINVPGHDSIAAKINIKGVSIDIYNGSSPKIIHAILSSVNAYAG